MISLNLRSISLQSLSLMLLLLALGGCSLFGDKEQDSAEAKSLPPLEVPPDLITPSTNPRYTSTPKPTPVGATAVAAAASSPATPAPASTTPVVELISDGRARWLRVNTDAEHLWPQVRKLLAEQGFIIAQDEPKLGFIETQWRERSEADGLVLPGTRDGVRVRIEAAPIAGHSDIHVAYKSARQENGQWMLLDGDAEAREIEMLNRLALLLGGSVPVMQQAAVVSPAVAAVPAAAASAQAASVPVLESAGDMTPAEKAAIDKRFKDIEDECALCRPR